MIDLLSAKRAVQSFALKHGYWIESTVPGARLIDLISKLRIVNVGCPLRRIGPVGDGGYLMPDDLKDVAALISPGVAQECRFDLEIADMNIPVYMLDGSVSGPPQSHRNFRFLPLFLDSFTSETTITIDDLCKDIAPGSDLLLQMDIEGAEYRVLQSASDGTLERFRTIVIEFHFLDLLFTERGYEEMAPVLERLLRTHHVTYLHANNVTPLRTSGKVSIPPTLEITFHRKDRSIVTELSRSYPHPLSTDNYSDKPRIVLPRYWVGDVA